MWLFQQWIVCSQNLLKYSIMEVGICLVVFSVVTVCLWACNVHLTTLELISMFYIITRKFNFTTWHSCMLPNFFWCNISNLLCVSIDIMLIREFYHMVAMYTSNNFRFNIPSKCEDQLVKYFENAKFHLVVMSLLRMLSTFWRNVSPGHTCVMRILQ